MGKNEQQEFISISELAKMLNITYQGAKKKLETNSDQLKRYLVLEDKKIKGITLEGLEELKKTPYRVSQVSKLNVELQKQETTSNIILETKEQVIKAKEEHISDLRKQLEVAQVENANLKSELDFYKNANVFTRLLGYKKK